MNEQTKRLYELAHKEVIETCQYTGMPSVTYEFDPEKFTELIKQALYDRVKEELTEDEIVDSEQNLFFREYLKGCNGGIVDALCIIKNFGVEE